tara:strand:+ start:31 stop:207 length:177 start_codon:yes stop_codon:yes gene_type:complete
MKKENKIITKDTSEFWKTKKGEIFIVRKIYWYNGEHHVKAFNEDREIDLPYVFFDRVK